MLTETQRLQFKQQLKERYYNLREEIRQELLNSDNEHFIDLAGQVHDLEEESVADLLVDLNLAILDMHIEEIRAIDSALIHLAEGSYAICVDCNDDIALDRLHITPTATRCTRCQSAFERNYAGAEHHTL